MSHCETTTTKTTITTHTVPTETREIHTLTEGHMTTGQPKIIVVKGPATTTSGGTIHVTLGSGGSGCTTTNVNLGAGAKAPSGTGDNSAVIPIEGTNLKTNTWYHVNLAAGGILTWTVNTAYINDTSYETAVCLQIVCGGHEPNYSHGGCYYKDAQWKMIQSEEPGYVTLVHKLHDHGVVRAVRHNYVGIHLDQDKNADYLPGGKDRDECLWKIEPEEGVKDRYQLSCKKYYPKGILTWNSQFLETGKHYVQIYPNYGAEDYPHNTDYIWRFDEIVE